MHDVTTTGGVTEFSFAATEKPTSVSVDPANFLLINR
jgi:hypothetical protein